MRYQGRVVLVTGGSRGIGEGCVRLFVEHGAKVTFCSNEQEEGAALELEVNSVGPGEAEFVFADCTIEADVKNVVEKCVSKWGRLDCLINNVGRCPPASTIDDYTTDDLRSVMELNTVSHFLFSKLCLPELRKHKGNIVIVSNLTPVTGMGRAVIYAMTKGAISSMSKALAVDEAKHGVRVNCVLPCAIDTPLLRGFCSSAAPDDMQAFLNEIAQWHLLGKLGTPRQVAEACLYLAAEGDYCTGTELRVNGGIELGFAKKSEMPDEQSN